MANTTKTVNKEVSEAMVEFATNMTKSIIDVQYKTWEDMVKLSGLVNKTTADMYKDFPFYKNTSEMVKNVSGMWVK